MPREEPPVATCGRLFGDLDFSANLGVSQSRAGDVVEKHREIGRAVNVVVKPVVASRVSSPVLQIFPSKTSIVLTNRSEGG